MNVGRMARGAGWMLAGVIALAVVAPGWARAEQDDAMDAATSQVKAGADQIAEGKVLAGTGELGKGVGNTIVEGTKATGRGLGRAGQVAGFGIRTAWDTSFDAVVDASDATVRFFKRAFDF
jgi:hypothetical protein